MGPTRSAAGQRQGETWGKPWAVSEDAEQRERNGARRGGGGCGEEGPGPRGGDGAPPNRAGSSLGRNAACARGAGLGASFPPAEPLPPQLRVRGRSPARGPTWARRDLSSSPGGARGPGASAAAGSASPAPPCRGRAGGGGGAGGGEARGGGGRGRGEEGEGGVGRRGRSGGRPRRLAQPTLRGPRLHSPAWSFPPHTPRDLSVLPSSPGETPVYVPNPVNSQPLLRPQRLHIPTPAPCAGEGGWTLAKHRIRFCKHLLRALQVPGTVPGAGGSETSKAGILNLTDSSRGGGPVRRARATLCNNARCWERFIGARGPGGAEEAERRRRAGKTAGLGSARLEWAGVDLPRKRLALRGFLLGDGLRNGPDDP